MGAEKVSEPMPDPRRDRISQRSVCGMLGFSERTGSLLAKAGGLLAALSERELRNPGRGVEAPAP